MKNKSNNNMLKFNYSLLVSFIIFAAQLSCTNTPKKKLSTENKIKISHELRRYVAKNIVLGDSIDPVLSNFAQVNFNDFDPTKFLNRLKNNKGRATCGLAAALLVKLLNQKNIEAYTYNFGFNKNLSHVVALIKIQNYPPKWIVQDPFYNCVIVDSLNKPKDFFEILVDLKKHNLKNTIIKEDTIFQKILMTFDTKKRFISKIDDECFKYFKNNYSTKEIPVTIQNCYSCLDNLVCDKWNFKKEFEKELMRAKYPANFIYGYLLQINQIWGSEPNKLQTKIDEFLKNS